MPRQTPGDLTALTIPCLIYTWSSAAFTPTLSTLSSLAFPALARASSGHVTWFPASSAGREPEVFLMGPQWRLWDRFRLVGGISSSIRTNYTGFVLCARRQKKTEYMRR
ncbi:hypothetical protein PoB_005494700 [Plakobranchus ocellatus]|uniref:Secreted protein n=1 Tax=Plakobranchus ocellatus TaxID=259542 RepID=A0AAV4CB05_9GAST|nr:hypothetical protein PoB_005494700 [Plakobranchus ocellatus]